MFRLFTSLLFLFWFTALSAQVPRDAVVPMTLSAGLNPPAVFINWTNLENSDIILRRRVKGAEGNTWVELVNATNTLLNGYFDNNVDPALTYEYAIERKTGDITANGYGFANFFTPVVDQRGKLLVFIDSSTADQLGADLIAFKNDIRGEGWQTVPIKTGPSTTVQWVKNKIVTAYNADPDHVKAVLLMGNVPIPYSGSMAWDTKADHVGAWPCDAYYGDVDGQWTDNTVNLPNTVRLANRNVPGDGKFDQNTLPSAIELPVGRLDFRRLSAGTFGANPVELLRKYLFKNHLFRTGQYKTPNTALVDDHLFWSGSEAFAADGFRNAYPLVGESNVMEGEFLNPQRHLLAYGAGANGTYSSADGIGTAQNFATDSVRSVFTNLYGDYFGDWDFETNPLLPALLASKGSVLTVSWAGRPHWMQHGLASGESIGYCLKETQNAQFNVAYGDSNGESGAHIALLGDPTLRAKVVAPPENLSLNSNCNKVNLHWTASPDPEVVAYVIYRSFSLDGPYTRITPDLVFQTSWEDLSPVADTLFYSVRAVKLEVTPGGGAFYNSSSGAPKSVIFVPGSGPTAIALGGFINCNMSTLTLGTNFNPPNSAVQWFKPDGQPLNGFTATEGGVYTVVVTAPNGCTTAAYATVYVDTLLPVINIPSEINANCTTPAVGFQVPPAPANVHYYHNGVEVFPGQFISLSSSLVFSVHSTANGCSKDYQVIVHEDFVPPGATISHSGLVLDCQHTTLELGAIANVPNASYAWSKNGGPEFSFAQNVDVTESGNYCLTVTNVVNGCTSSACVAVTASGGVFPVSIGFVGEFCFPGSRTLKAMPAGGIAPYTYAWSTGETTQSMILLPNYSGNISVTVTDAQLCEVVSTKNISPVMEVFVLKNDESAPGASDGYIDLLVLNGMPPIQFNWSNGSTSEDISGLSSGTYSVTITAGDGCTKTFSITLLVVGTSEAGFSEKLVVAPNPASSEVRIFFEDQQVAGLRVRLTDLSGRVVVTQTGIGAEIRLPISSIPTGVYMLWVSTDKSARTVPLVIQR